MVLITIDTLRADRLGSYGAGAATPSIDALAAAGTLFENVATPMPETRPAHASLFTSRYPRHHGVLSNAMTLDGGALTLAEVYAAAGYQTAAFVGCVLVDATSGVSQGFAVLDGPVGEPRRPAGAVVDPAIEWLRAADPRRPIFLWVHLFDPHMPYEPPASFQPALGPAVSPEVAATVSAAGGIEWRGILAAAERNAGDLPAPVLERALRLYDGEVAYADRQVGRLFEELRVSGRWSRALIALTADHGECFGNGIWFDHSGCLYEGAVRIPLLLRGPGVEARARRPDQAELLDLAPTLLRLSGLAVPPSFTGRDLLAPSAQERPAFLQHPVYRPSDVRDRQSVMATLRSVAGEPTRAIVGDRELLGVRTARWKYLAAPGEVELFDLVGDPLERRDLAASEPEQARALRRALAEWRGRYPVQLRPDAEISPALRESLRALGYL